MAFKAPAKGEVREKRKHCQNCCYYVDGVKERYPDGRPMFFPTPGMQHHRSSTGTMYEKIGYTKACECTLKKKTEEVEF